MSTIADGVHRKCVSIRGGNRTTANDNYDYCYRPRDTIASSGARVVLYNIYWVPGASHAPQNGRRQ